MGHKGEKGGQLLFGLQDFKIQVGPVKAGDQLHGVPKAQQPGHVGADLPRGGGGEGGHHRPPWQGGHKVPDLQIAGAEILPPLGDAVGLVHRHQWDVQTLGQLGKPFGKEPLGGHIKQLIFPRPGSAVGVPDVGFGLGAVEKAGGDPRLPQRHDLIRHQRDEGGDDDGHPGQEQCGDLVAHGFAASGGHDPQHVTVGQNAVDKSLLPGAEGVMAKVTAKGF